MFVSKQMTNNAVIPNNSVMPNNVVTPKNYVMPSNVVMPKINFKITVLLAVLLETNIKPL